MVLDSCSSLCNTFWMITNFPEFFPSNSMVPNVPSSVFDKIHLGDFEMFLLKSRVALSSFDKVSPALVKFLGGSSTFDKTRLSDLKGEIRMISLNSSAVSIVF